MINVLLHAPEDFSNLCVLARTLDFLGIDQCSVFDPRGLVRPRYGKAYRRRQQSLSSGAFSRIKFNAIDDSLVFIQTHPGRAVATSPSSTGVALETFRFLPNDLIVFGPEGSGLPEAILSACTSRVTIPQRGATGSLNLVVAVGIILFEANRQLEGTSPGVGCVAATPLALAVDPASH